MVRYNNLYDKICNLANIELADYKARKNKSHNYGVIRHDKHKQEHYKELLTRLLNCDYHTSRYSTFTIYEPKERLIYRLPYYPDRILHHAVMNVMEPIWTKLFIKNTYSCIKNRGIHQMIKDIRKVLDTDKEGTKYCLKLDILKFYPSINHEILYQIVSKKIKDKRLLLLLKEIIYSSDGVPIGNYLSLFFANLYLTYFDHYLKESLKCKYYFRYADDMIILDSDKTHLRQILELIKSYLSNILKLNLKDNYQIFPVDVRGIDIVGYKLFHTHTLLRKSIKLKMKQLVNKLFYNKIADSSFNKRIASYIGWCKFCNSKHLLQSLYKLVDKRILTNWNGINISISKHIDKYINLICIIPYKSYYRLNYVYNNKSYSCKSVDYRLYSILEQLTLPKHIKIQYYERY